MGSFSFQKALFVLLLKYFIRYLLYYRLSCMAGIFELLFLLLIHWHFSAMLLDVVSGIRLLLFLIIN